MWLFDVNWVNVWLYWLYYREHLLFDFHRTKMCIFDYKSLSMSGLVGQ